MAEPDPTRSQHLKTLLNFPEVNAGHSFPLFRTPGEKPKNALERVLSIFADVRAGEGLVVLLLTLDVFLLLSAYYLLKTSREALILSERTAAVKAYVSAGQAVLLLLLIPLYGWIGAKVDRLKLVGGLSLFFISNLIIFAILGNSGVREAIPFFVWVGIFNVFVISQFWAFANDIYTEGQGRRLFPLIGVGASVGALIGSQIAEHLIEEFKVTPYGLMYLAVVVLLVTVVLLAGVNRGEARRAPAEFAKEAEEPLSSVGAFELIRDDRYLFWIAVLTILLNLVNSCGEYLLGELVTQNAANLGLSGADKRQYIGAFYGSYFSWVNGLGLILQAFFVSRIFRYVGVRGALFFMPVLGLMSYSVMAVAPLLAIVRGVKILENATDYSVQNTVRQALWLPTSREAKYKAKAAVDTFCARFGDVAAAGVVYLGRNVFKLAVSQFAWISVGMIVVWLWVAGQIAGLHRRRTV